MSAAAEKAAEVTAEVVEESIDGVVDVIEVVRNNPVTLALVGVVALAAGGVGGYFLGVKRLGNEFDERLAFEIEETKEFYANLYKTDPDGAVMTPQQVLEERHGPQAAADAVRIYQGRQAAETAFDEVDEQDEAQIRKIQEARLQSVSLVHPVEVVETTESRNVWIDPHFDYEEEVKLRTTTKPYIITHDEYFEAEKEYETISLTYFEDDDTLVNERDEPIREIDKMVGEDHLARFGHGSKDKNIVYVRSDRLETDFEIVKSTGSYLEQVLGIKDEPSGELKHSDQRDRRRAFRHGDG